MAKGPECEGVTKAGRPCRRTALAGARYCAAHVRRAPGRPSLLTDEVADRIVSLLATGAYPETAAMAAGVSRRTFFSWMERGDLEGDDPADEPYRRFHERVDEARAKAEALHVGTITKAARDGDWRASAWWLERVVPEQFARPSQRGDVSPSRGGDGVGADPAGTTLDALDTGVVDINERRRSAGS